MPTPSENKASKIIYPAATATSLGRFSKCTAKSAIVTATATDSPRFGGAARRAFTPPFASGLSRPALTGTCGVTSTQSW